MYFITRSGVSDRENPIQNTPKTNPDLCLLRPVIAWTSDGVEQLFIVRKIEQIGGRFAERTIEALESLIEG